MTSKFGWFGVILVTLTSILQNSTDVNAQSAEDCRQYTSVVSDDQIAVFPDQLLANWRIATACLADILDGISARITSTEIAITEYNIVVKATGAINTIVSTFDKKEVINYIRTKDTIGLVSVLSWGARNVDRVVRLNTTILLANIVDNDTICVPIDHLYDENFLDTAEGVHGRANLLAVVSVIAPWAYKENYKNILSLIRYIKPAVEDDPNLIKTRSLVDSICTRLTLQETYSNPNMNASLPNFLRLCARDYSPLWAEDRLRYDEEITLTRAAVCG